jgi:hypothetical protein
MTRKLAIIPALALALVAVAACTKSNAPEREGHDHASQMAAEHEVGDHQMGEDHAQPAAAETTKRIVPVSVGDKGFEPSRVELKKGQDATLRFTRTTDTTCATKVVFPELKVEKELPLNQAVDVTVPTDEPRQLAFQCGMGMYKSAVVIN